jgi:hypothetical protein
MLGDEHINSKMQSLHGENGGYEEGLVPDFRDQDNGDGLH